MWSFNFEYVPKFDGQARCKKSMGVSYVRNNSASRPDGSKLVVSMLDFSQLVLFQFCRSKEPSSVDLAKGKGTCTNKDTTQRGQHTCYSTEETKSSENEVTSQTNAEQYSHWHEDCRWESRLGPELPRLGRSTQLACPSHHHD